jgi:phosphoribosyl 1,2-cyclic phosphodiesterase
MGTIYRNTKKISRLSAEKYHEARMLVKLWGTRGSLPQAQSNHQFLKRIDQLIAIADAKGITDIHEFRRALNEKRLVDIAHYGGNTTCTEIRNGSEKVFIDCGSGIVDAWEQLAQGNPTEINIFQTHMHWDHLLGLPFFIPIYIPGNTIKIHHIHANAPEFIRILFNGVNFPVRWEELNANIEFVRLKLYEPIEVAGMKAVAFALDHPGGSFGYRFEVEQKSVAIGVDGEYKRLTPKELGKDLEYYKNLDLLLFDAQYELNELASRFDWGHSSPPIGVDLALREGIRKLVLCHHDPRGGCDRAQAMLDSARKYCKSQLSAFRDQWVRLGQPDGPEICSAYDGLEITP